MQAWMDVVQTSRAGLTAATNIRLTQARTATPPGPLSFWLRIGTPAAAKPRAIIARLHILPPFR